jgi:hypothetical protein
MVMKNPSSAAFSSRLDHSHGWLPSCQLLKCMQYSYTQLEGGHHSAELTSCHPTTGTRAEGFAIWFRYVLITQALFIIFRLIFHNCKIYKICQWRYMLLFFLWHPWKTNVQSYVCKLWCSSFFVYWFMQTNFNHNYIYVSKSVNVDWSIIVYSDIHLSILLFPEIMCVVSSGNIHWSWAFPVSTIWSDHSFSFQKSVLWAKICC